MKSFLSRFAPLILFTLSGFDRLRLRGESRLLNHSLGVQSYLWQRRVLFKDYPQHAEHLTAILRRHTEAAAVEQAIPFRYLDSPDIDKEGVACDLARQFPSRRGRIALLSCVESCTSYRLRKNDRGLVEPRQMPGKCLHYYHYFDHEQLGLCYVRIQSWFPFAVRVGLNGRHWLARQLQNRNIPFRKQGNLLLEVADPALAQELLDDQTRTDWPAVLQQLVQPIQPLWSYLHEQANVPYYWMTEQSEWATDFIFRSPADLAQWYPRWIRHGIQTLQCKDVLRFLGKKVPENGYGGCDLEARIDLRTRTEGTRLKFWYGTNSLKMYDKEAQALRLEATLNDPKGFKVFRTKEGEASDAAKSWQHLRKGVADLGRRAEVSHAANNRLAESLARVDQSTTLGKLLEPLGSATQDAKGRRIRALNPSTGSDGELLRALARGDFLLNGFRNRDLRLALYGANADPTTTRRQASAITRKLALLRGHGLIHKVPTTHRYQLSAQGKRILTALSAAHAADVDRLTSAA